MDEKKKMLKKKKNELEKAIERDLNPYGNIPTIPKFNATRPSQLAFLWFRIKN